MTHSCVDTSPNLFTRCCCLSVYSYTDRQAHTDREIDILQWGKYRWAKELLIISLRAAGLKLPKAERTFSRTNNVDHWPRDLKTTPSVICDLNDHFTKSQVSTSVQFEGTGHADRSKGATANVASYEGRDTALSTTRTTPTNSDLSNERWLTADDGSKPLTKTPAALFS